jgi:hypothetical protein
MALKKLGDSHKAACRLRIEGQKNEEIAKTLKISKRTLEIWFSDPLVKDYLQDIAANVEVAFAEKLATAGMTAIHQLTELVEKPDATTDITVSQKVQVAREILDRIPSLAPVRDRPLPQTGDINNYLAIFQGMGDQDLAALIQRWANGDGASADQSLPVIDA